MNGVGRMLGFVRFFWNAQRGIWAVFVPALLVASTVNWMMSETQDRLLELMLGAAGLISAHLVFHKTSRETIEYARQLPLRRETALFLPYLATGASVLLLALLVHAYELAGLAYWPATAWARLRDLEVAFPARHRPAAILPGFFGWPLFAYWSCLWGIEELRKWIDAEVVVRVTKAYVLLLLLGVLLVWLAIWSARGEVPTGAVLLLLAALLVLRVRRLVVHGPIESWPTKEQAWES